MLYSAKRAYRPCAHGVYLLCNHHHSMFTVMVMMVIMTMMMYARDSKKLVQRHVVIWAQAYGHPYLCTRARWVHTACMYRVLVWQRSHLEVDVCQRRLGFVKVPFLSRLAEKNCLKSAKSADWPRRLEAFLEKLKNETIDFRSKENPQGTRTPWPQGTLTTWPPLLNLKMAILANLCTSRFEDVPT